MAVGVVIVLLCLAILIIVSVMFGWLPEAEAEAAVAAGREQAVSWSKTFVTTVGGIAVGVLARGRLRSRESSMESTQNHGTDS